VRRQKGWKPVARKPLEKKGVLKEEHLIRGDGAESGYGTS
jgi:hypothetical protein